MYDLHYPLQSPSVYYDSGGIRLPLILLAAFNLDSIFKMIYSEISRRESINDNSIRLR